MKTIEIRNIIVWGTTANSVEWETPIWTIDWVNVNFALANTPVNQIQVYLNGMRQKETEDYTASSNTFTLNIAPIPGDILLVDYNF